MEELKVTVMPGGKIQLEASGFIGDKCTVELKEFNRILATRGATVSNTDTKKKYEQMYASNPGEQVRR